MSAPVRLDELLTEARAFAEAFASVRHPLLMGVTDGKAVGTYIETAFKLALTERGLIGAAEGNRQRASTCPA